MNILDIDWNSVLSWTIENAMQRLLQSFILDTKQYVKCLSSIMDRARFLNVYVYSKVQILPFPSSFWAQLNKYTGYFLWFNQLVGTPR